MILLEDIIVFDVFFVVVVGIFVVDVFLIINVVFITCG